MFRKTLIAVTAVAALLCLSSMASAQTVDEIIAKNMAAKGGLEKLKGIQTMRTVGTMTSQGQPSVQMTFISKRPNLSRQEIVMGAQTMVMVFDGTRARMINPMMGPTPIDMPAEQVEMIKDQSDIDGPLVDYKAKGYLIELVGVETLDTKKVFHLRVTRKLLPVQDLYLDGVTYLEAKMSTMVPGSGVIETVFGDYRQVDGMTMPFSVKNVAAGMTLSEMKLSRIEVNQNVNDSVFTIK